MRDGVLGGGGGGGRVEETDWREGKDCAKKMGRCKKRAAAATSH